MGKPTSLWRKSSPAQHNSTIEKAVIFTFSTLYLSALAKERLKGKPEDVFAFFPQKQNKQATLAPPSPTTSFFPVVLSGSKFPKKFWKKKTRNSTDSWSNQWQIAKPTHDQRKKEVISRSYFLWKHGNSLSESTWALPGPFLPQEGALVSKMAPPRVGPRAPQAWQERFPTQHPEQWGFR